MCQGLTRYPGGSMLAKHVPRVHLAAVDIVAGAFAAPPPCVRPSDTRRACYVRSPRFHDVLTHVRTVRPDISDPTAAIEERRLVVDGVLVTNASALVRTDASVSVRVAKPLAGRRKLDPALAGFRTDIGGGTWVDLGAAAGGFTTSLLSRGAGHVYAIDVGFGRLRGSLRLDARVTNLERTNLADAARHIPATERVSCSLWICRSSRRRRRCRRSATCRSRRALR